MLFNSIAFLLFLPTVFLLYWSVKKHRKIQNFIIFVASYFFYGCWNWRFLLLLFLTTFLSFVSGLLLEKYERWSTRKLICGSNIIINLAILGYFKYFNFFVGSLQDLFSLAGYQLDAITLQVVLPVGISFYTFQALSYSIDVYRKQIRATHEFFSFASFIAFFPQLVAGPIEQASNLLPQFLRSRHFDYNTAVQGMRQILWGFFKKIIIADNCAKLANGVFDHYTDVNGSMLILGMLFFTFQIYGDFSGYSDIALGTARLFGVQLRRNFDLPYFSRDISEFWRRWHISLNKWFIQYIYIPLGGNRNGKKKHIRNILVVFLLSGLWHGANWTFIVWGLYNGILLVISTFYPHRYCELSDYRIIPSFKDITRILGTFCLCSFGWVIFRAQTLSDAVIYFRLLFSQNPFTHPNYSAAGGINSFQVFFTIGFIILLQVTEWLQRDKEFALDLSEVHSRTIRWSIYIGFLIVFSVFAGSQAEFIYFQF